MDMKSTGHVSSKGVIKIVVSREMVLFFGTANFIQTTTKYIVKTFYLVQFVKCLLI